MRGLTDSSIARYAVIEARWAKAPSERFVFAYSDEASLREVIAGPSIVASGFASREEAQANIETGLTASAWKAIERTCALGGGEKPQARVLSAKTRWHAGFNLADKAKLVHSFVQAAVAAAAFTFYSRNAASAVVRSCLGA